MLTVLQLKDISEITMGQSPSGETYNTINEGLPLLNGAADYKGENFNPKVYTSKPTKTVNKGDIIVGIRGTIGNLAFGDREYCIGRGCAGIRVNEEIVLKKFASLFIDKSIKEMSSKASGSTIKGLKKDDIESIEVPIPFIETQKKIVEVLDKARALIDTRKEQIRLLDNLIESIFYDMFGDPVTNPKGWEKKRLNNVAIKITDGTHHSPKSQISGIPYITAKHLNKNEINFYSNPTYVSKEAHKVIFSRCNPEYGDILYIKDGATTGIAAINKYKFEFSMLSSLALIKVNDQCLNNYYLTLFLNNERAKDNIIKDMSGGAIKRLTIKKIKEIEINMPPIHLQNQFAEIVQKIESQKQLMEKSLDEMENNYNSLMQRAFKGELFA